VFDQSQVGRQSRHSQTEIGEDGKIQSGYKLTGQSKAETSINSQRGLRNEFGLHEGGHRAETGDSGFRSGVQRGNSNNLSQNANGLHRGESGRETGDSEFRAGYQRSNGNDWNQSSRGLPHGKSGSHEGGHLTETDSEFRTGFQRANGNDWNQNSNGLQRSGFGSHKGVHKAIGDADSEFRLSPQRGNGNDWNQNSNRANRGNSGSHEGGHQSEARDLDFRAGFQRGDGGNWNQRSSEAIHGARHELRDALKNLRSDLKGFQSDSIDGHSSRPIGFTEKQIDRILRIASRGIEDGRNQGDNSARFARRIAYDASGVVRLAEHFSRLESIGGEPVRRAYRAVLDFVLNDSQPEARRFQLIRELLRDLGSGAFLRLDDVEGPFPLTGRARIVSEMMHLMRTLQAIDEFAAEMNGNPARLNPSIPQQLPLVISADLVGSELLALILEVFNYSMPTFPGLAGRVEIPRLISLLGGNLSDAAGRPLVIVDGAPLRLGDLLFFNTQADAALDLWAINRFSARVMPLVSSYGFDAVYSLIGFDGRALAFPRFMAIQSQINASQFEWLFGQGQLNEGWLRSAIEALKDSISVDHNVLGEMLEEALTTGRFHLTVMRGTVEEGKAVSGSFSFAPVPVGNAALGCA
jgi:hypothetical protein